MLSRKKKTPEAQSPSVANPYADAQHVWIERYGSFISQAYNWRLLAMLEAIALIAAVVGLVYVASQTKFVPYVVAIDKVGASFAVSPAERASSIDPHVLRAELAQFIFYSRTVTKDRALQKISLERAYNFVQRGSAARGFLDEYYPKNDPFQRSSHETVQTAISNVLPVSPTSYELQWVETIRDSGSGQLIRNEDWEATVNTTFASPGDESAILRNPLGLFITTLTWEKKG